MMYDFNLGLVEGTVTRLSLDGTNGQSTSFTRNLHAGLTFSNTDAVDVLLIASTNGVTGVTRFDNFVFEIIPEPSCATVLLLAGTTLSLRRRSRSR